MIRNMSSVDRLGRVAFGFALLSLFFFGSHAGWALTGLVPLVSGMLGWCPVHQLLGISTCTRAGSERLKWLT